ncbi:hypothetical protein AB3Y40_02900 [Yoonia sp. R2331]|uniref:hypothetical protein n=1 Tax=Yoonia sp. R2331 TaxID=3237238 RepID=UPI0034E55772
MSIKTLTLAAAAVAITAGAASANTFGFQESVEDRNSIELGLVTAAADGVVEIYNLKAGEQGALLGMQSVNAGANDDVRINIGNGFKTDVLAVLKVDGQIVATEEFDVAR